MYLTKVTVNLANLNPDKFDALIGADSYFSHQLLWDLFPNTEKRDFLYRQSMTPKGRETGSRGLPEFYVLSATKPDQKNDVLQCQTKDMPTTIPDGMTLAFKIRANPTVAKRVEGKARSVRHDVMMNTKHELKQEGVTDAVQIAEAMEQAALEWIQKQGERNGFVVRQCSVVGNTQQKIRSRTQDISYTSVDYEGELQVTDTELFAKALTKGLGRSKGFGCGMLMIRPAARPS